jgi:SNF2 family DNA or RNA helicase
MVELASWQVPSSDFLLEHDGVAGLFDEPPKTYPAIDAAVRRGGPHLFVVPGYLIDNWEEEIRAIHPETKVSAARGTAQQKAKAVADRSADIVLCSYKLLGMTQKRRYMDLLERRWAGVVFDESHRLRGRNSQSTFQHQFVKAPVTNYISATPLVGSGGDLWPHLHRMDKGGGHKHYKGCRGERFGGYWPFVREWCVMDYSPFGETAGLVREEMHEKFVQEVLAGWSMRRLASQIPELAHLVSYEQPIRFHPSAAWLKEYRRFKKEWKDSQGVTADSGGAYVHKLRRMTADPASGKFATLQGILEDRPGVKPTIWCWYKTTAEMLQDALTRAIGFKPYLITGDIRNRHEVVKRFNEDPRPIPLVTTIGSLQEGENVQGSHLAIFYEGHYRGGPLEQCVRRHRRYGQTHPVEVIWLMALGTVDERVYRIARSRAGKGTLMELVSSVLSEP